MHKLLGNFQANSRCFPKILHSWEKFYRTTGPTVPTNIKSAQLLIKYKSGALVTQYIFVLFHCHLYSFYLIVACLLGPQHLFQVDRTPSTQPLPPGAPPSPIRTSSKYSHKFVSARINHSGMRPDKIAHIFLTSSTSSLKRFNFSSLEIGFSDRREDELKTIGGELPPRKFDKSEILKIMCLKFPPI